MTSKKEQTESLKNDLKKERLAKEERHIERMIKRDHEYETRDITLPTTGRSR